MPVVCKENMGNGVEPVVHCMKWGLVPSFTKKNEKPDHFRMFNARSESVHEKASFRRLIPSCRCLVTVEGFYEWKKDGAKKQPFYIHFQNERPLVFAALYDTWTDSEGCKLLTFTILTTRCSKALEWLHDRMPVILGSKDAMDAWLNDLSSITYDMITKPYEASDLVWYPVTSAMGRTQFDGPECIKEIVVKPEKKNTISDLFSKSRTPAKTHVDKNYEAGIVHDQPFLADDDLSIQEQKGFLVGVEPDKEATNEMLPCMKEEKPLEHCGAKRPFEDVCTEFIAPSDEQSGEKTSSIDKLKERSSPSTRPSLQQKKKSDVHVTKDTQQTLLSYFGRSQINGESIANSL